MSILLKYAEGKIAASIKGRSSTFLSERRGVENDSTKRKRGSTWGKEGNELLGKVTVIRRAHRVISHKAGGAEDACISLLSKLSAKYISPPRYLLASRQHFIPTFALSLFLSSLFTASLFVSTDLLFYFYVVCCNSFPFLLALISTRVFFSVIINLFFNIFFFLVSSVSPRRAVERFRSFACVSRGLIRLMDIRNWCNCPPECRRTSAVADPAAPWYNSSSQRETRPVSWIFRAVRLAVILGCIIQNLSCLASYEVPYYA